MALSDSVYLKRKWREISCGKCIFFFFKETLLLCTDHLQSRPQDGAMWLYVKKLVMEEEFR